MNNYIYFFDIVKDASIKTKTNDIQVVTNEYSVAEEIKNLFDTAEGERIFKPQFHINVRKYLFEPLDMSTALDLAKEVQYAIKSNITRAINPEVDVFLDEDNYLMTVNIEYEVATSTQVQKLELDLKRLR